MLAFYIMLIFGEVLACIAALFLVILNYRPTKLIIIEALKKNVYKFHSEYLYDNWRFRFMGINKLEALDEAIRLLIKSPSDFYDIPDHKILLTGWCLYILNNYKKCAFFLVRFLITTMVICVALSVGIMLRLS